MKCICEGVSHQKKLIEIIFDMSELHAFEFRVKVEILPVTYWRQPARRGAYFSSSHIIYDESLLRQRVSSTFRERTYQ
jgi:hypothetical protein